jgi:hypothetical protein
LDKVVGSVQRKAAWIGVVIVMQATLSSLFEVFREVARNKKLRQGFLLIWLATIWIIWKARNNAIFANGLINPSELVEEVKVLSWKYVEPCEIKSEALLVL